MTERAPPDRTFWMGRSAGALVIRALLTSASVQSFVPHLAADMSRDAGFAPAIAPVPGTIIVAWALLYAIPASAVVGAILAAGSLGAICAHLRLANRDLRRTSYRRGSASRPGAASIRAPGAATPSADPPVSQSLTSRARPQRHQTSNIRTPT